MLAAQGGVAQHAPPLHVADAVRAVRSRILAGVRLVFTRVIPTQQHSRPGGVHAHAAHKLATELGAEVHADVGDDGTDKVRWAKERDGVHVVSVEWLATCGYLWRAVPEADYPVQHMAPAEPGHEAERLQPTSQLEPPTPAPPE